MKVRCKYSTIDEIVDQKIRVKLLEEKIYGIDLKKNKEYNVCGIKIYEKKMYFLIFYDDNCCFPDAYLADFFEVIDSRMSRYFRFFSNSDNLEINSKEWIEDQCFYEKILDDYSEEIIKYREYKKLIDSEFSNLRMQLMELTNNISFFSNQFGIISGIVNRFDLDKSKWYDVDIKFKNPLELNVNYYINEDDDLFSIIDNDRLIMNLKIEEIYDEILDDAYISNLVCNFNNCKITIPIIPYHEEIKKGDSVKIKCDSKQVIINILDE
nr:hypothetical protein GTC16762_23250 [Pigmentibacter ruber]